MWILLQHTITDQKILTQEIIKLPDEGAVNETTEIGIFKRLKARFYFSHIYAVRYPKGVVSTDFAANSYLDLFKNLTFFF